MNLKQLYGKRYRVTLDESWEHEKEEGKSLNEWRYHEIKGKFGTLYPYSKDQLTCLFTSLIIANRFNNRGWKVIQSGDTEINIFIPFENVEEVLRAIRPKKRRQLSDDQKKVNAERLRRFYFGRKPHENTSPRAKA